MAKKNFSASPLMTFITPASQPQPDAPEKAPAEAAEGQGSAAAINDTPEAETAPKAPEMPQQTAAPAPDQIEPPANSRKPKKRAQIAERNARFRSAPPTPPEYFARPDMEEPRSRRVQLLIKPSIYKEIRGIAHWKRQSFNNLIEEILSEYLDGHDHRGARRVTGQREP